MEWWRSTVEEQVAAVLGVIYMYRGYIYVGIGIGIGIEIGMEGDGVGWNSYSHGNYTIK